MRIIIVILALLVLAFGGTGFIVWTRYGSARPSGEFVSVRMLEDKVSAGGVLHVEAVLRGGEDLERCSLLNGYWITYPDKAVARVNAYRLQRPAPGTAETTTVLYSVDVPIDIPPGEAELMVRETWFCDGRRPRRAVTPKIGFQIVSS